MWIACHVINLHYDTPSFDIAQSDKVIVLSHLLASKHNEHFHMEVTHHGTVELLF